MGQTMVAGEALVAGQDDLGHHVAVLTVIFEFLLGAQVIEANKTDGFAGKPGISCITGDDIKAAFVEFEGYVSAGFYDMVFVPGGEIF